MSRNVRFTLIMALVGFAGCKEERVPACTENGGDNFCKSIGSRFCSVCKDGRGGCQTTKPEDDCYFEAATGTNTGGDDCGDCGDGHMYEDISTSMESGDATGTTGDGDGDGDICDGVPKDMVCVLGGDLVRGIPGGITETYSIEDLAVDMTEVTVGDYAVCVAEGGCTAPSAANPACTWGSTNPDLPVNCVRWSDAIDYCEYVQKRVPTQWEWEWAGRGADQGFRYPWGFDSPSCTYLIMDDPNYAASSGCGAGSPVQVGSRSPTGDSFHGIKDMSGNVREWVLSEEPPGSQEQHVKGGAFSTSLSQFVDWFDVSGRVTQDPNNPAPENGFRCVRDL